MLTRDTPIAVAAVSLPQAPVTYTCRFNPANWARGALPRAGSIVSFPASFSRFGVDGCASATAAQCGSITGGLAEIRQTTSAAPAVTTIAKLQLPRKGKLQLIGDTTVAFVKEPAGGAQSPPAAKWADSTLDFRQDPKCGANWNVQGTAVNPFFAIPCFLDVAVFDAVGTNYISEDWRR